MYCCYHWCHYLGLNQAVAVDATGTRIADFEVLDLVDPDTETFEVK